MAEETKPQEDRTEAATPQRLKKAREEGHVPVSRELATLAGLACAVLALALVGSTTWQELALRLSVFLAHADEPALAGPEGLRLASTATLRGIAPIVLATLAGGAGAVLLQTGFLLNGHALRPDLARLSPLAGLRRLWGTESVIEALKSVLKLAAIGFAVWQVLAGDLPVLTRLPFQDPHVLLAQLGPPVLHVLVVVLVAQAVIAGLDVFWARFRHGRQLRMSRQDLRDEQKETDGDPQIKARIRRIRLQRSRKRMMAAVAKATVVIINPTHYAVALAYDREKNAAPRLVAKGVDQMAARIREVAEANRVPIVTNPPLARALFRAEMDADIPAEHYQAVAEIIAYLWRLGAHARPRQAA
jgi:flagellar biosynthetic protein FlhB